MARIGYSVSRYSSRRRRLAIAQTACHDLERSVNSHWLNYPAQDSHTAELLQQHAKSEIPRSWLFLGGGMPAKLTASGFEVDSIGHQIRQLVNRQNDVFIDATRHITDLEELVTSSKEMLTRYRPDFVVIHCGNLIARSAEIQNFFESEEALVAILQALSGTDTVSVLFLPYRVETEASCSDLIRELVRSLAAEHDACLIDCSQMEAQRQGQSEPSTPGLNSQSSKNLATMFGVLLSEVVNERRDQQTA